MSYQVVNLTLNDDRQFIVTGNKPETMGQIAVGFLTNEGTRQPTISGFFSWNMDSLYAFRRVVQVIQQHLISIGYTPAANGYVALIVTVPKVRESADLLAKHFSHLLYPHIGYAFTPNEVEILLGPKIVP